MSGRLDRRVLVAAWSLAWVAVLDFTGSDEDPNECNPGDEMSSMVPLLAQSVRVEFDGDKVLISDSAVTDDPESRGFWEESVDEETPFRFPSSCPETGDMV